jgi:hypothetical protein
MKPVRIPGPGAHHREERPKSGGMPFGRKNTTDSFLSKGGSGPGPGKYDVSTKTTKIAGGSFGIKTQGALDPRNTTANHLGPGTYSKLDGAQKSKSVAKDVGFGTSYRSKDKNQTPGPGMYSLDKTGTQSQTFGTSKRSNINGKTERAPGPG